MTSDTPQDNAGDHSDEPSVKKEQQAGRSAEDAAFIIHTANVVLPQQLRAGIKQCLQKDAAFNAWKHFYVSGDKEQLRRDVAAMTVLPTITSVLIGVAVATRPTTQDEPKKGMRGFFQKLASWNDDLGMTLFMTTFAGTHKKDRPEGLNASQHELYALFVGGRRYWTDPAANPSATLRDALQRAAARTMLKSLPDLLAGSGSLVATDGCDWNKVTREIMHPVAAADLHSSTPKAQHKPRR